MSGEVAAIPQTSPANPTDVKRHHSSTLIVVQVDNSDRKGSSSYRTMERWELLAICELSVGDVIAELHFDW